MTAMINNEHMVIEQDKVGGGNDQGIAQITMIMMLMVMLVKTRMICSYWR